MTGNDVCPAGGTHTWTDDTGPLPLWHHSPTLHCDECQATFDPALHELDAYRDGPDPDTTEQKEQPDDY